MRFRLLLLIILFCGQSLFAIQFKRLDSKDGLSQLSVLSIYQDKLGRMWFGTEEGVNIFDGYSVIPYKTFISDDDRDERRETNIVTDVNAIVGDTAGNVYFISDHSVVRYDLALQKFRFVVRGGVYSLYSVDNMLYVGRHNTLLCLSAAGGSPKTICKVPAGCHVTYIYRDGRKRLWIGTSNGLYRKDGGRTLREVIPQCEIYEIFEDSRHNVWVSTRDNGCFLLREAGGMVNFLARDKDAWQSYYNFSQSETFSSGRIAGNMVRGINEDSDGNIWIGTFVGLNKYDYHTGLFTVYAHTNNPYSLSHSSVFPVYKDRDGTIWVGTYFGGVNYFNPRTDMFTFYSADVNRADCLSYPFVGHMVEDKNGYLWICTEGGGLNRLDRKTGKITHYMKGRNGNDIVHNNLKNIVYDAKRNKLYIGTHTGGLTYYDIAANRFHNIWNIHPDYRARFGDQIFGMCLIGDMLVFTTPQGIWKANVVTDRIEPLFPSGKKYGNSSFHIDHKGYIWIAADAGLYRIKLNNERDRRFYKAGTKGLSPYYVTDINEDSRRRVYVVTRGGGMAQYDSKADSFIVMNVQNCGIVSDFCYEVVPSGKYLLINSDRGISIFDPSTRLARNIEFSPDFPLTGMHRGCGMVTCRDGSVFVGGTNGLVSFRTEKIRDARNGCKLYVSRLFVKNKEVLPGDDTGVLSVAAYRTRRVDLKYSQNDLSVVFAKTDYVGTYHNTVYEYMMEGYEDRWVQTTSHRITYTQIVPGSYTLVIREKPRVGQGETPELRLRVVVHPPLYKTWWAYLVYMALFLGGVYYVYRFKRAELLLRTSLEMEKKEKKNIKELNKAKLRFFTSISHEFRTPLTLLIAKLDAIIAETTPGTTLHKRVTALSQHANQLMELINELLDFRKMEQGFTRLEVAETDMVAFARNVYQGFVAYAQANDVTYRFSSTEPSILCWFDAKQMEKVLYNLLSNAFKYVSKRQGVVEVQVSAEQDSVILKVMDNGVGIQRKDMNKIFDRFYQIGEGPDGVGHVMGTGIGLALVKEIVDLHHGLVHVESSPGYGSIFIVTLRKGREMFSDDEIVEANRETVSLKPYNEKVLAEQDETVDELIPLPPSGDGRSYTVLLVEDNEDLLITLRELFGKTYRVLTARDGVEGLEMTRKEMPDLVVSDVMMPRMSGTDMCRRIKDDITVCHIPVVLLTAMGSTESTIEGFRCNADEYVAKPFDARLLIVRCNNLVRSRILLRKKIMEEDRGEAELLATTPLDREFLKRCDSYIEANMANSDFSVDMMAKAMVMGRSSFFNKFKELTGMTPNDYMQNCRLRASAIWLNDKPDLQISDIAYRLGFSSPRYFSHCFKAKYGMTPKEFRSKGA
ncbi:histidine kinase [Prevotella sp. S7-1-8]|uniref:hybrid sensor histidine kinase/response regulator transcription factor n=1 Tax=Prevotella sp. S7-1-8 TaxID=1284775 RepID=UPI00050EAC1D|nr:hybrid sensor histidine kinase/response regulator transcription factor [Prevotella sp. S7-1-8]KGF17293.1 histidine kinase [Prevotella sp. S7-1-8]